MGPSKTTASTSVDKINYGRSFNILESAKVHRYLEALSHEDILKDRLSGFKDIEKSIGKDNIDKFIIMLSNIYQSVTTKGLTTYETISYIVDTVNSFEDPTRKNILGLLENYFSIFHLDYTRDQKINATDRDKEVLSVINYSYNSAVEKYYSNNKDSITDPDIDATIFENRLYNTSEFLNHKGQNRSQQNLNSNIVNQNIIKPTKENTSLSVVLLNNESMRGGIKNSLELSTFFNLIPTIEYAKAYPYFNATFILPTISKQDTKTIFRTATLNQFLFGGVDNSKKTENFNGFEGKIFKDDVGLGVKTNLSVFTTPQTAVNMNEKVGHNENLSSDKKRLRVTNVHDKTRSFMTLKDFTIDVSPTKGLMSFKTGKISLVLHDRTRMVDIAPFIKPDLFGAFGAEIVVEYGWTHNESQSTKKKPTDISANPIGDFIDSSRCIEKYMITNSQFTIENNGQVNINLSIAMKGPIDIRQTEIFADATKSVDQNILVAAISEYNASFAELVGPKSNANAFNFQDANGFFTNLYAKKKLTKKTRRRLNRLSRELSELDKVNNKVLKTRRIDLSSSLELKDPDEKTLFRKYYGINVLAGPSVSDAKSVAKSLKSIRGIIRKFISVDNEISEQQRDFVDDLIGGTSFHDMFFDVNMLDRLDGEYNIFVNEDEYVTLGTIITSLIGTHMAPTKKYDEIQIIFHTVNDKLGLASNYKKTDESKNIYKLNIASLLIKRSDLKKYLENIFETKTRLTLESLISQIITKFIMTKDNPCYGLTGLYSRDKFDSPVKPKKRIKDKDIREKLNELYYGNDTDLYDDDPQFVPPSIHLTFDALTSRENRDLTICRITVYDRNNNPYQSICDLYNKSFLDRTKGIHKIRQIMKELESKKINNKERIQKEGKVKSFIKKLSQGDDAIFTKEMQDGKIFYKFKTGFGFNDLKAKYKKLIPTATFATQNTSLINASVATVNEGKLNTVYITRQDRNKTSELNNQVIVDMPLRILPAQASIEIFGCPWINFGQYIFLDFETGTTIDNTYAVTGVKHTISPGKFTTSVSLSYGDVYGKYEGISDTFNSALDKFAASEEKEEDTSTQTKTVKRASKTTRTSPKTKSKPTQTRSPSTQSSRSSTSSTDVLPALEPPAMPSTPEPLNEDSPPPEANRIEETPRPSRPMSILNNRESALQASRQRRQNSKNLNSKTLRFNFYDLFFGVNFHKNNQIPLDRSKPVKEAAYRFLETFKIYHIDENNKQRLFLDKENLQLNKDFSRDFLIVEKSVLKKGENATKKLYYMKNKKGSNRKLEIKCPVEEIDNEVVMKFFVIQNPEAINDLHEYFEYNVKYFNKKEKKSYTKQGNARIAGSPTASFMWELHITSSGWLYGKYNFLSVDELYTTYKNCPIYNNINSSFFLDRGPIDDPVWIYAITQKEKPLRSSGLSVPFDETVLELKVKEIEANPSNYNFFNFILNNFKSEFNKNYMHYNLAENFYEYIYILNLRRYSYLFNEKLETHKHLVDNVYKKKDVPFKGYKEKTPHSAKYITRFENFLLREVPTVGPQRPLAEERTKQEVLLNNFFNFLDMKG